MSAADPIELENFVTTPEFYEWCAAESADNCVLAARQHLGRAMLAIDAALAEECDGGVAGARDLTAALHAVRAARGLLRIARGCTRGLVKATAGRREAQRKTAG
jgi:hypothetical protein